MARLLARTVQFQKTPVLPFRRLVVVNVHAFFQGEGRGAREGSLSVGDPGNAGAVQIATFRAS